MDFLFKDLIVWQRAMQFAKLVYGLVKQLPVEERYALADQLRRAAASVPSNIAEGNGRAGNKDYAHFLAIARGSLYETITQLELAKELGYVGGDSRSRPTLDEIYSLAGEVSRMLTTMLKKFKHPLSTSTFHLHLNITIRQDVNITFRTAAKLASALKMDFFPELRPREVTQKLPNMV